MEALYTGMLIGRTRTRPEDLPALQGASDSGYKDEVNSLRLVLCVAAGIAAAPAVAGAGNFMLVNGTAEALADISVRPLGGGAWQTLGSGSLAGGARQAIAFSDDRCGFELRATVAGGRQLSWPNVNLCDTKVVTLNRRPDGTSWVEYD